MAESNEDKLSKWAREARILLAKARADGVIIKVHGGKRTPATITLDVVK